MHYITYIFLTSIKHWQTSEMICTASHKSPHQLFVSGMILLQHSHLTALDFLNDIDDTYGIDEDGCQPTSDEVIIVPRVHFQLSPPNLHLLRSLINPLQTWN